MAPPTSADIKAKLERLIRIRGYIFNFIENARKTSNEELRSQPAYVTKKLADLNDYWVDFQNRHEFAYAHRVLAPDHEYFVEDCFLDVEDAVARHYATLQSWMPQPPAQADQSSSDQRNTSTFAEAITVAQIQSQQAYQFERFLKSATEIQAVPPIALPTFSGKQEDWDSFKVRFEAAVLSKPYSDTLKLHYLLDAVQGVAADMLKGTNPVGTNFQPTWDKLCRRYNHPRRRMIAHMHALQSLQPLTEKSSVKLNELLNKAEEAVQGFRDLKLPVDQWDSFLVYCIVSKLDTNTREAWETNQMSVTGFSTYQDLLRFIENRIFTLDSAAMYAALNSSSCQNSNQSKPRSSSQTSNSKNPLSVNVANVNSNKPNSSSSKAKDICPCDGKHPLYKCETFDKWTVQQRFDFAKQNRLCLNCLRSGHFLKKCTSKSRCSVAGCNGAHHSKLHTGAYTKNATKPADPKDKPNSTNTNTPLVANTALVGKSCILATARVILQAPSGESLEVRALIDPGAERSFVADRVVKALSLPVEKISQDVSFLGGESGLTVRAEASLLLRSGIRSSFRLQFSALVLSELTRVLPAEQVDVSHCSHLAKLDLADPEFASPQKVDCVLAADVYTEIILPGLRKGKKDAPVAQNTVFGWILTGNTATARSRGTASCFHVALNDSLSTSLQKFWEIEELPDATQHLSPEEKCCENYFKSTVAFDADGRIVVRLPFSQTKVPAFLDSRDIAVACLLRSERKRQRDAQLNTAYADFMNEYEQLGHMKLAEQTPASGPVVYLPHHPVFRRETNKLRVVFNASQRTGNGHSINDFLLPGPKLQIDICIIVIRWRFFKFAFSTDIVKMFRQIRVHPDDCNWQRIVWRDSRSQQILDFILLTITYGTACAPYLANRALIFLAEQFGEKFPLAAIILMLLRYVDDIFGGGDTLQHALAARDQLIAILQQARIPLDKWAASVPELLQGVESKSEKELDVGSEEVVSTLGLKWSTSSDEFFFRVEMPTQSATVTKRTILSEISKLFDPLGWLAPFLVQGKILLQELWLQKLDWDVPLEGELLVKWTSLRAQMPELSLIRVPRWLGTITSTDWELHGFADASMSAYSAAIYLVVPGNSSLLLMSKNRVAPIKTQSLPRLELCAAVLLVRLIKHVESQLQHKPKSMFCWSDSKVALDWIAGSPARWQTFVANRVSEIQVSLPAAKWAHVPTDENPADLATRGKTVQELKNSELWWHGPHWVTQGTSNWPPQANVEIQEHLEVRVHAVFREKENSDVLEPLDKWSSFSKVIRIIAYCYRWRINASRLKRHRNVSFLTREERRAAKFAIFRAIQRRHYADEIKALENGQRIPRQSQLRRLAPFLCPQGVLRVGGRLPNSALSYSEKHPIILSSHSVFVRRMVEELHRDSLHGGVQLMLSLLFRWAWIPRVVKLVQGIYRKCVRCARFGAKPLVQQMAPLPAVRLTPRMAFEAVGVDYAGPISILFSRARGAKSVKGYFTIFVCMITKAVHIEVVSDLTSAAFLAAFRRFVSRRGRCSDVYSDNGTNFTGANRELKHLFRQASSFSQEVAALLAKDEVTWHFSPPRAPHFGGLWEAAVKSFKYHLKRVVGDAILTFEEFATLTSQIEACLNSRPMCPLSSDGDDLVALTPGHFITGRSMSAIPEPFDAQERTASPRSRWRLIQNMRNHFWDRWRKEVMHQYQQRGKWHDVRDQLKVGDIVLVKDELTPPTKWPLARVISLHPGHDGHVRVVDLQTASSTCRRALDKLVWLPTEPEEDQLRAIRNQQHRAADDLENPTA